MTHIVFALLKLQEQTEAENTQVINRHDATTERSTPAHVAVSFSLPANFLGKLKSWWNQASCFVRNHSVISVLLETSCSIVHDPVLLCKKSLACSIYYRNIKQAESKQWGGHNNMCIIILKQLSITNECCSVQFLLGLCQTYVSSTLRVVLLLK